MPCSARSIQPASPVTSARATHTSTITEVPAGVALSQVAFGRVNSRSASVGVCEPAAARVAEPLVDLPGEGLGAPKPAGVAVDAEELQRRQGEHRVVLEQRPAPRPCRR
jgi:hypothetical protein